MAEYYKAIVDFSDHADGDLSAPAHKVHDTTLLNAATFPNLPITMAQLFTDTDSWDKKLADSLKGGTDRTTLKNDARAILEDDLFQLGTYGQRGGQRQQGGHRPERLR